MTVVDALDAERQVAGCVAYSEHAVPYVAGIVTAEQFGSARLSRLYRAACDLTIHQTLDDRVAALADTAGCHVDEVRLLVDTRTPHLDASRYAHRIVECAQARRLAERLAWAHRRLHETGQVAPVVAELRGIVA